MWPILVCILCRHRHVHYPSFATQCGRMASTRSINQHVRITSIYSIYYSRLLQVLLLLPGHPISTLPILSCSQPETSDLDLLGQLTPSVKQGSLQPSSLNTCEGHSILELEFVEMAELTIQDDPSCSAYWLPAPAHPPIKNVSQWIKRYSLTAALLCTRFQDRLQNSLPIRQQLYGLNTTMRVLGGHHTTTRIGGKPNPRPYIHWDIHWTGLGNR